MKLSFDIFDLFYPRPPKPTVDLFLTYFRKILVSVKFLSAILGPEMGASILWTPGKMRFFCRKKPCP